MSNAPTTLLEAEKAFSKDSAYLEHLGKVNGMMHRGKSLSGRERNCVFLNRGDGSFATISALSGYDMADDARGLAVMDWDFDGKLDFWSSARTAPRIRFMHNELVESGEWIGFKLQGNGKSNRDAIGSRITVTLKNGRKIIRTLRAGEGYVSQSSKWVHFGLGEIKEPVVISIRWPDGSIEKHADVSVGSYYQLTQGSKLVVHQNRDLSNSASGEPLQAPKVPAGIRVPLRIAIPAPPLPYTDEANKNKALNLKLTRPLLINLWDHECVECVKELQDLSEEWVKLNGKIDILALHMNPSDGDDAEGIAFLKKLNIPIQYGLPKAISRKLLVDIFHSTFPLQVDIPSPSSLLISSQGEIVALYTRSMSPEELLKDVKELAMVATTMQERDELAAPYSGRWLKQPQDLDVLYLARQLQNAGHLAEAALYTRSASKQLSKHKEYALMLLWIAETYLARGDIEQAMAFYKDALARGGSKPQVLNNVAWLYATSKHAMARNPLESVRLAYRACKLTEWKNPYYLDTLAACYASTGEFKNALQVANMALVISKTSGDKALQASIEKAMQFYMRSVDPNK